MEGVGEGDDGNEWLSQTVRLAFSSAWPVFGWDENSDDAYASEGEDKTQGSLKSGYAREVWLVYHETRRHDTALRYVCDWIIKVFQNSQFKQSGAGSSEPEYW